MKREVDRRRGFRYRCARALATWVCLVFAVPPLAAELALLDAVQGGDVATVSEVLHAGADPNTLRIDGSTSLQVAVLNDHLEVVAALLAAGADPTLANRNGVTPLWLAVQNGNFEIVAALLDAGASANTRALTGETVLMAAAGGGRADLTELLIAQGAIIDAREPEYQQTALMIAARTGGADVIPVLVRHGADVNAQTKLGPRPVFHPPCKGTGCGSEGVGINRAGRPDRGERHPREGGMSALLYAAREGFADAARLLVEAGADKELAEANGITPLLMALLNNQLDVASLLLDRGAKVNVADFWGRTPLFASVDYRNLDMNSNLEGEPTDNGVDRPAVLKMIVRLLDEGANVNARTTEWPPQKMWLYALNDVSWVDVTGQTPFFRAALSGDTTTMRLLLEHGADPNIPTYLGTTPLMAAAGVNWTVDQTYTESPESLLEAVKLCLAQGADVNAANSMGLTALLGAVNRGSNDIVRFLAEHGAQLDVVDAVGRTAMQWAEGVFLAAVGQEQKPETIALLAELMEAQRAAARNEHD